MKSLFQKKEVLSIDRKTTYSLLKDKIQFQSEKIIYEEENHRLK